MDDCTAHSTHQIPAEERDHLEIVYFPKNMDLSKQPVNAGVTAAFKKRYRLNLMSVIVHELGKLKR